MPASDAKTAVSLFSGAGGMDIGFTRAGFRIVFANEIDADAAATYQTNPHHLEPSAMRCGDILDNIASLDELGTVDLVFGGPPCQGFSVAGKMNPDDDRSKLIWTFMDIVEKLRPTAFVMENVKALGTIARWTDVREKLFAQANRLGYGTAPMVLSATDFGVPQARERFFLIGVRGLTSCDLAAHLNHALDNQRCAAPTVREAFHTIAPYGSPSNSAGSTAEIRLAKNPVLRQSAYQGSLLFNGRGRPVDLDQPAKTLPAQMGGNHTPIVDQHLLDHPGGFDWIATYHAQLLEHSITPEQAATHIPSTLRRMTIREAATLQTFPIDFEFKGKRNKQYRQIGNAVPCKLAEAVARSVAAVLTQLANETP